MSKSQPVASVIIGKGDTTPLLDQHRVLLIAQSDHAPKTIIKSVTSAAAKELLGEDSEAFFALRRFKEYNEVTPVDVLSLGKSGNGAFSGAKASIKVKKAITEELKYILVLGDDEFFTAITFEKGTTEAQAANKIIETINAIVRSPFSAVASPGDDKIVEITCKLKGASYNGTKIIMKGAVVLTSDSVDTVFEIKDFANAVGACDYTIDLVLEKIQERYHSIIVDNHDILYPKVSKFLEARINDTNDVKGGVGFLMVDSDASALKVLGNAKNEKSMCVLGNPAEMRMFALRILATAEFVAKRALRLTDGANIADIVTNVNEAIGGMDKGSLPYHNTPMNYLLPLEDKLSYGEVNEITNSGITLFVPSVTSFVAGKVVTTYKQDATGTEDITFRYLNTVDTAMLCQEYFFKNMKSKYGQTRLTKGSAQQGVAIVNQETIRLDIANWYKDLANVTLVQSGAQVFEAFSKALSITIDTKIGNVNTKMSLPVVGQLRSIQALVKIEFNLGGF